MTALADAMFQLLIFFMLATSLTPYSLLPLQSGGTPAEAGTGSADTEPTPARTLVDSNVVIWTVQANTVTIASQSFGFDRLDALAGALGNPGAPAEVVLLVAPEATVQDLTRVLEALRLGEVGAVRISTVQEG